VGFSANCSSPNELENEKENWKCHLVDFRLISLYGSFHQVGKTHNL